ncbi:MAG: glycoside hydrolase family 11 protein [Oscillospiraceae bacterium]|nr:glycoside hydrolase family 11 protein [Oscillospiraceae bacterium]
MKKQLFGAAAAVMLAFTSAPFATTAQAVSDFEISGQTPDGSYDYDVWNQAQIGTVTYEGIDANGGAFSCTWTDTHYCVFYKGHNIEMPKGRTYKDLGSISCEYAIDYFSDGFSEYGIHGTIENCNPPGSANQQVEYYIIDGYNKLSLGSAKPCGQLTDNGCTYDIYRIPVIDGGDLDVPKYLLTRYYSVIVEDDNPVKTGEPASASHRIDIDKHFDAWEKAGMYMRGEVKSVEFSVTGYDCSGEATITKNEIVISKTPEPVIPGDVDGDGKFTHADCELLRKWLLAVPDTELSCLAVGDFNQDDRLDAIDLSMMMRTLAEIETAPAYPGPVYEIIVRPVAYFSNDFEEHNDSWKSAMTMQAEAEIQYLKEIKVTKGTLIDPAAGEPLPADDPAYTITGSGPDGYFDAADLNTDLTLHVENKGNIHSSEDNAVADIIGFETKARNIIHVSDAAGNRMPDERDTEVKPYSTSEVTYHMYVRPNSSGNPEAYCNTAANNVLTYNEIRSSEPDQLPATMTLSDASIFTGAANHLSEKSRTGATYYTATVIEYNVMTGEMRVLPSLQQGEPVPEHPLPN